MKIELVREQPNANGAVHGRVCVDGAFFAYSLENAAYTFPNGTYSLYGKRSPTFGKNKVYIDVPGRSNILFHGGNSIEDTKGCVIVAAERDGDKVKGDQSDFLFDVVDMAGAAGEPVGLVVRNDRTKIYLILGLGALGALYLYSKR